MWWRNYYKYFPKKSKGKNIEIKMKDKFNTSHKKIIKEI